MIANIECIIIRDDFQMSFLFFFGVFMENNLIISFCRYYQSTTNNNNNNLACPCIIKISPIRQLSDRLDDDTIPFIGIIIVCFGETAKGV